MWYLESTLQNPNGCLAILQSNISKNRKKKKKRGKKRKEKKCFSRQKWLRQQSIEGPGWTWIPLSRVKYTIHGAEYNNYRAWKCN